MADSRHFDLEELVKHRDKARNAYERDLYDKTIDTVMRESGAVRERRDKLIQAIRNKDQRAVKRFQHDLTMLKAEKTHGHDY